MHNILTNWEKKQGCNNKFLDITIVVSINVKYYIFNPCPNILFLLILKKFILVIFIVQNIFKTFYFWEY